MWTYQDGTGTTVAGIRREQDARAFVHRQGTAEWAGPYAWTVTDSAGRRYPASIRYVSR